MVAMLWAGGDGGIGPGLWKQKWEGVADSSCILKVEPMGLANGLDVREGEESIMTKVFGLSHWKGGMTIC